MKNYISILLILVSMVSNAQYGNFRGSNNYVAPVITYLSPLPVTAGIVLNLDAASTTSYSGNGTTWTDISGSINNATLEGNPLFTQSPAGFTFGSNKFASTPSRISSMPAGTFIAWVYSNQTHAGYAGIIFSRPGYGGSTAGATGLNLYSNNSVGYHWNDSSASYNWDSGLYVPNNVWTMIAITVNATTAKAYLCQANGITTALNPTSNPTISNLNFYVGCDPFDKVGRSFNGKISKAMIYNVALSQSDITSIFNAQKSYYGL
jgi:hypothetical protein